MLFGSVASILLSEIIRSSNLPERRASCISWTGLDGLDWTCKTRTSKTRTCKTRTQDRLLRTSFLKIFFAFVNRIKLNDEQTFTIDV